MIILNFSHPIPPVQQQQIESLAGQPVEEVITVPTHFDNTTAFKPQFETLMASLPLSAEQLQTAPILVNLPSLNFIAAMLLAELHGRMGHFPPVIRTRPLSDQVPMQYEVAEILNLNQLREAARAKRY